MYNNYNPYYQPRFQQPMQPQYDAQAFIKPTGLQGKSVDSIDVVKATDIPLDGTVSYFPLTDGSAIVTKQLGNDGNSKIVLYKPVEEQNTSKYVTQDDLDELKKTISDLKKQIKELKKSEGE